jgi:uncharacterized protein CbrC (UPF0167 family)
MEHLPQFRYHPDPVATGNVIASSAECRSCGRARGYVYVGPVYAEEELGEVLCPWCIGDRSAAERFDAEFTDAEGVGDRGRWGAVPVAVLDEVTRRTPGFAGWQPERWWVHCGDAAAFLGRAGRRELEGRWVAALPAIRAEAGLEADGAVWAIYLAALDAGGAPTAYVFRCLHCGQFGGYSDTD